MPILGVKAGETVPILLGRGAHQPTFVGERDDDIQRFDCLQGLRGW